MRLKALKFNNVTKLLFITYGIDIYAFSDVNFRR